MLFQPAGAVRSVSRGVAIDYFLKAAPDKADHRILDGQGSVIRTFTGTPRRKKPRRAPAQQRDDILRPSCRTRRRETGNEPIYLGYAVPDARDFPGLDHVGGQHAGAAGATRKVLGATDGQRRHKDGDALRSPATKPSRRSPTPISSSSSSWPVRSATRSAPRMKRWSGSGA